MLAGPTIAANIKAASFICSFENGRPAPAAAAAAASVHGRLTFSAISEQYSLLLLLQAAAGCVPITDSAVAATAAAAD